MTVTINGSTGITSVNGTATAPSITGADTNTGIVYGADTLSLATGGVAAVTVDSSQDVTLASALTAAGLVTASAGLTVTGTATATTFSGSGASLTGIPLPAALSTASGSPPSYSARAWVNFNGTGTIAIRGSGNVLSLGDRGAGAYTVNLTTAMPDTNGSIAATQGRYSTGVVEPVQGPAAQMDTTSTILVNCGSNTTTKNDAQDVYVTVFR